MTPPHPPARSFRLRRRRLSPTRVERYHQLRERWALTAASASAFDWANVTLDIGFGGGEALIELAAQRPHEAVVGVEVHTPGVANVLDAIAENAWQHVHVCEDDVLVLLPKLPKDSLAGVRLYFPDPWPKRKQRHRRLARPDVIAELVGRLRLGGTLHFATDSVEYSAQVQEVCGSDARLRGGVVPRPEWRPLTRFETRGLVAGREPIDLIYERVS